jgi:hypothetical protein
MKQFLEFIDRRQREAAKHLKLVEKMLKKNGMDVKSFLEEEEPYIFVKATEDVSFEGIRIYEIGKSLAYRVQKEPETHPYGIAYSLNLEDMFNDFMSDNINEDQAAKKVVESTVKEIKKFFKKTAEAEQELGNASQIPGSNYILRTGGSDYSSLVLNKM